MAVYLCKNNIFVLETKNTHYALGIDQKGCNRHIYWGKKCPVEDYEVTAGWDENSNHSMLDGISQELTVFGGTLYRESGVKVRFSDGCRELDIEFLSANAEENTLTLCFGDKYYPIKFYLDYQVYPDSDIIGKTVRVKNEGEDTVILERIFSGELSLPSKKPYTFKNTNGAWGGEFIPAESRLEGGSLVYDSKRGTTGHNQSPYFIAYQNADEDMGEVYFGALAYSGSFKVIANRDLFGTTRVLLGINDFDFEYDLAPDEEFTAPYIYCGKCEGFGEMSRQMSRFAVENIMPKGFAKKVLPVLYNSWEATEFNISCEQQLKLAEQAQKAGAELFVMDDGWFGKRNNDRAGLGDWFVNREKFPNGLSELIDGVNALGLDFGIWVEPEMVNPDSELYRAHPDWAYHYPTRAAHTLRHQLVLNLTKPEVQEYIFNCLDTLLSENNIKYIKWDMNRPFSETGGENLACPKSLWYRHTMAVYKIVDGLKKRHPQTAFESCSSGGGRADLGALSHFDQVWTSDNTDAADRMTIQRGFSLLYPIKAMRAWVTDIAGLNKPASLDFRFNIAMQGALGLGGNLLNYTDEDIEICRKNVELYKKIRKTVQFGSLYRGYSPDSDDGVLFNLYVSEDKNSAVAFIAASGTRFFKKAIPFYFKGLDKNARYRLEIDGKAYEKSGAYLENAGISLYIRGKDYNRIIQIEKIG